MVAAPGDWTNILYGALARRFDIEAVILEHPISRTVLLRRRAARIGWLRALDQAAFSLVLAPILRYRSRRRIASLRARLGAETPIPERRIVHVVSVNAPACLEELRRRTPSVVVVSGTRIIAAPIIEGVGAPFVNMHAGVTPRYRGVHGAYWALADGRPEAAGVTVHRVDLGIDTGAILGQARITPEPSDSVVTYPYLQVEAGIPLLIEAIEAVGAGRIQAIASIDASESKLRYHPSLLGYLARRLSRGIR